MSLGKTIFSNNFIMKLRYLSVPGAGKRAKAERGKRSPLLTEDEYQ